MFELSAPTKQKIGITAGFAVVLFLLLITRPWRASTIIDYSKLPTAASVSLVLEDSWGREVTKVYTSDLGQSIMNYGSTKVLSLSTDWPEPITLDVAINGVTMSHTFVGRLGKLPEPFSARWDASVLLSILLFIGFYSAVFLLLLFDWENHIRLHRKSQIFIVSLVVGFSLALFLLNPGLLGWDIFSYYVGATRYGGSTFIGRLLSHLLVAGNQLLPEFWVYTAFSLFITSLSLYHIHAMACRHKVELWFYSLFLIFLVYPANFYLTFFPIRDVPAAWCFSMTLLKLYEIWIEKNYAWLTFGWLAFFAVCAVGMRQEAIIPIALALFLVWWREKLDQRRKILAVTATTVIMWLGFNFNVTQDQIQKDIYQTTLLIHPLSSILVEKYPDGLPAEVDQRLGKYFKNDYLLLYYSPYDINPFHFGGLDRQKATHEDYLHFRSAALGIIWENFDLWLKSRLMLTKAMLGLETSRAFYVEDNSYVWYSAEIPKMVHEVPMHPHKRLDWVQFIIEKWKQLVTRSEIEVQSFLIPAVIWLLGALLNRGRMFYILSLMLFLRSLIVLVVAPAAYYRYQFSLWIFMAFSLVYVMAERKKASKEMSSRTLPEAVDLGNL